MNNDVIMIMGIGILVMGLVLMVVLLILGKKHYKVRRPSRAKGQNEQGGRCLLSLYKWMSKWPLTKRSIYHIRSRIEITGHTNERIVRLKVAKLYLIVLSLLAGVFVIILSLSPEPVMIVLWLFVLWILSETLVDFFVVRLKNKLLWQQIKFNELVRHKYYQTKMVDEAIYDTCMDLDKNHYEVSLQGERIYDILLARNPEKEMMAYNEVAPNKYLKMFLSLAYMTMEYGDAYSDGVSVFMKNLHDLTNEVRIELTKRERLNYALRSLNVIVLIPLMLMAPIEKWACNYFMPLKQFYESQTGFILEIVMVFVILICYVLLRRVQQFDKQGTSYVRKVALEDRLYAMGLKVIVDRIKPKASTSKHRRLSRKLKVTRSHLSVEGYVLRQIIYALLMFIGTLVIIMVLHYNTRAQVFTLPTIQESFLGGQVSEEEMAKAEAITKRDNQYLSQINRETTLEEIIQLLIDEGYVEDEAKYVASGISRKQVILLNQKLKIYEILIALLLALLSYQVPNMLILFRQRLLKLEVEDEVMGFSTIILMLMHHERLSITDILEWFEMYAVTFREPLGDCLNNLTSGMTEALETLKESSDNEQFERIIEGLILASQDISIRQAFDELDTEKNYHLEKRKENNLRTVNKKINIGNAIGFFPVYALIVLYMIVPMIYVGMQDMEKYFEQLRL